MKTVSVRLSDSDLRNLDFLSVRFYDPFFAQCEDIKLPLSPVIRASICLAADVISHYPDIDLDNPFFALPDGSGAAGSRR